MADMAGMLELSDREFKTTVIIMLRALMDRANNIQEERAINAKRKKFF